MKTETISFKERTIKTARSFLLSVASFVIVVSMEGCTDKAAEIRDQECLNISSLLSEKRAVLTLQDPQSAEVILKEMSILLDQYSVKCEKNKK